MEQARISPALEDYLETIYNLHEACGAVRVTDVAEQMSISKPSVNRAMGALKKQGLVDHEPYGLLALTPEGLRLARNVARRHSVILRFLRDVLKVDEDAAQGEACAVEHAISADTIDKLENFLDSLENN